MYYFDFVQKVATCVRGEFCEGLLTVLRTWWEPSPVAPFLCELKDASADPTAALLSLRQRRCRIPERRLRAAAKQVQVHFRQRHSKISRGYCPSRVPSDMESGTRQHRLQTHIIAHFNILSKTTYARQGSEAVGKQSVGCMQRGRTEVKQSPLQQGEIRNQRMQFHVPFVYAGKQ
eukprot:1175721-Prorocentrum_minimum.AAC.4